MKGNTERKLFFSKTKLICIAHFTFAFLFFFKKKNVGHFSEGASVCDGVFFLLHEKVDNIFFVKLIKIFYSLLMMTIDPSLPILFTTFLTFLCLRPLPLLLCPSVSLL